jgi:transcriptional regulator with XRE-family HTH domain
MRSGAGLGFLFLAPRGTSPQEAPLHDHPAQCLEARKLLNWSRDRLSARCEVSHTPLWKFERGARSLWPEALVSLVGALAEAGVEFALRRTRCKPAEGEGHHAMKKHSSLLIGLLLVGCFVALLVAFVLFEHYRAEGHLPW